jgi:hypothetical protein
MSGKAKTQLVRIPVVLTEPIELDGVYKGIWIRLWKNLSLDLFEQLEAAREAKEFHELRKIIGEVIGDWNVADPADEGAKLAHDATGLGKVPLEMILQFVDKLTASQQLPKGDAAPSAPTTPPSS